MTRGVLQQTAPAPPSIPVQSEAGMRLDALQHQQQSLIGQLVQLESERPSVARELGSATGPARADLASTLTRIDNQIAGIKTALSDTRQKLSELQAAPALPPAQPGLLVPPPDQSMFGHSRDEFMGAASFLLLFPLVIAIASRVWRGGRTKHVVSDSEEAMRFARLEQVVESVAIEVERIGESQRFTAKVLTERQPEPMSDKPREVSKVERL